MTAKIAQTCTLTVPVAVTDAESVTSAFDRVPSDADTATGLPTTAPLTEAVPVAQVPAVKADPPMLPVVPSKTGTTPDG